MGVFGDGEEDKGDKGPRRNEGEEDEVGEPEGKKGEEEGERLGDKKEGERGGEPFKKVGEEGERLGDKKGAIFSFEFFSFVWSGLLVPCVFNSTTYLALGLRGEQGKPSEVRGTTALVE